MTGQLVCWRCGADVSRLPQPLGRRAECDACHAELHVCRMCRHYDPGKAKQCRETMADEVKHKSRANFCEWFQAQADASSPATPVKNDARHALDALFGGGAGKDSNEGTDKGNPRSDLDRLFGD